MTPFDAQKLVNRLLQALDDVPEGRNTAGWDVDAAVLVWDALLELQALTNLLVRTHAITLAGRLPDEYEHATVGKVHGEWEKKEQWDGNGLLGALGREMADTETGEIEPAIAVRTLREILPACGPNQTSSKWKRTGLQAAGINTGNYQNTEWGSKLLKRGPKYRRGTTSPPTEQGAESNMEGNR